MASTCLVILCGLPAVGKTSFAKKLQQTTESCGLGQTPSYIIVEYDSLLPQDLEKILIQSDINQQSKWKSYRAEIVKCVDSLLECLQKGQKTQNKWELPDTPPDTVSQELWGKFTSMVKNTSAWEQGASGTVYVVIDDNMYYTSMRYSYYQLARKYQTGFCQVYLYTEIETAISQNAKRVVKVTDDVISTMATKMEVPDGKKNSWERNSITIHDIDNVQPVFKLFSNAVSNPVQPVEEVDIEQQDQSRVVCSENFVYQSDQILRRLVSQEMKEAKERCLTKTDMKTLAGVLQSVRKRILEDMKSGLLCIPSSLVAIVTDSSKDTSSAVFHFLREKFHIYYKEINR